MDIDKQAFSALIEYYKLLPKDKKRAEIISELENMIDSYSIMCTKLNIMPNMLLNKEILNMNKKNLTEDEFLHALYAYINALQDVSAQFIEKMETFLEDK